jgi:hypothetical protein
MSTILLLFDSGRPFISFLSVASGVEIKNRHPAAISCGSPSDSGRTNKLIFLENINYH